MQGRVTNLLVILLCVVIAYTFVAVLTTAGQVNEDVVTSAGLSSCDQDSVLDCERCQPSHDCSGVQGHCCQIDMAPLQVIPELTSDTSPWAAAGDALVVRLENERLFRPPIVL